VRCLFFGLALLSASGAHPAAGPVQAESADLGLPTQEEFRGWPPRELLQRHYWLSWGAGSLDRAALFNRPILFVLDAQWSRAARAAIRGPLGDPRVIEAINRGFVAIRVDADLRPDVRERYQTGKWPAIAFLLPDGNPMLSTMNDSGADRPITVGTVDADAMLYLVREGEKYWSLASDELFARGRVWAAHEGPLKPLLGIVDTDASDKLVDWMQVNADVSDGGFGAAPKFVLPFLVEFALHRASRGAPELLSHARKSLERLLASPLFDEEEGGVRRMAGAPSYGAIEPEKLLAGNTALIRELTFAIRDDDTPELRRALAATTRFVMETLARPGGGFYLAYTPATAADGEPQLVRTVLSGQNVLAGAALLRAATLLGDREIEVAGTAALELVMSRGIVPGQGLRHALEPRSSTRPYLESLADAAFGFLDAYESTGRRPYLDAARSLVDFARSRLAEPLSAALLDHAKDEASVGLLANPRRPLRPNARIARTMIRLDQHGLGAGYREAGLAILGYFCGNLSGFRAHGTEAALAIEEAVNEPLRIRIDGPTGQPLPRAFRAAAMTVSWPWTSVEIGDPRAMPSAAVSWRGQLREVTDPERLGSVVAKMTGGEGAR
jgi:uncharacterized protein YyaL (SSP411 family)